MLGGLRARHSELADIKATAAFGMVLQAKRKPCLLVAVYTDDVGHLAALYSTGRYDHVGSVLDTF